MTRRGEVRAFRTPEDLARAAATHLAERIARRVAEGGRCSLVLSGGRTPALLYRALVEADGARIPWSAVHVFWGDERWVPADHPDSNARMAREHLLARVPIPPENVHPIPTGLASPEDAAAAYDEIVARELTRAQGFDLMLLGIGREGHTASLFPASAAARERRRMVVAARVPAAPAERVTLTLPAINRSREIHVLVAGEDKAAALRDAVAGPVDPEVCPASGILPAAGGILVWWADEEAASMLE